ncbi:YkgJ family cysteine cluster protein [Archangium violaceum]|uniref:YkgJ family cysteine cluster protein n=1 Tax=Archangium violaceum TaxID=83451 RepID=UPI00193BB10F|nr:YkgJ family cysteine cluster protein [Archangium violaceum]QRK08099.1 YkgJ family cysteine cluster protein [Archangium violaceum]
MEPLSEEQRKTLEALYRRIDERVSSITGSHAWWPCRKGCDHCCRHLAAPLTVTRMEWTYLWEGFQALSAEARAEVRARVTELHGTQRPYTCPFLERESGGCRVYAHRPLVCRSYGFYMSRGTGNWCQLIQGLLEQHGDGDIVWGNQDTLEEILARLGGATLSLFEWFEAPPTTGC